MPYEWTICQQTGTYKTVRMAILRYLNDEVSRPEPTDRYRRSCQTDDSFLYGEGVTNSLGHMFKFELSPSDDDSRFFSLSVTLYVWFECEVSMLFKFNFHYYGSPPNTEPKEGVKHVCGNKRTITRVTVVVYLATIGSIPHSHAPTIIPNQPTNQQPQTSNNEWQNARMNEWMLKGHWFKIDQLLISSSWMSEWN